MHLTNILVGVTSLAYQTFLTRWTKILEDAIITQITMCNNSSVSFDLLGDFPDNFRIV